MMSLLRTPRWRPQRPQRLQPLLAAAAPLALCAALGLPSPPAWAGRDDGQRALQARQGGLALPLEQLIRQVAEVIPGRLLEAELEDDEGQLVYELRWQLADGRRLELALDARNGRWLKLEGPRLETVFRRPAAAGPATASAPATTRPPPRPAAAPR